MSVSDGSRSPVLIEGPFFADVFAQPAALADTWAACAAVNDDPWTALGDRLRARSFRHVVLTGMGASFHALVPLALALTEAGHSVTSVETSELIHYAPALLDNALVIAVSQSGRSAETVALTTLIAARKATLVGVTNDPQSPLGRAAAHVLLTRAGHEATVSCKTYVATLLALAWLAPRLCAGDIAAANQRLALAPALVSAYLERQPGRRAVEALATSLLNVCDVFFVGRGASLAAAGTAGLIVKEATPFHAEGMSSAAFRHGPFEMLRPDVLVVVMEGAATTAGLNARLVDDVVRVGGRAVLVGARAGDGAFDLPVVDAALLPLLEAQPAYLLALALGAMAGVEAGRFSRASKITATE